MQKSRSRLAPERFAALKLISATSGLGLLTLWHLDWRPNTAWICGVSLGWGWALAALAFPLLGRPWVRVFAGLETGFRFTITALSLGLAFFAVVTPISWVGKVFGKGFLGAKSGTGLTGEGKDSYWKERKPLMASQDGPRPHREEEKQEPPWDRPY